MQAKLSERAPSAPKSPLPQDVSSSIFHVPVLPTSTYTTENLESLGLSSSSNAPCTGDGGQALRHRISRPAASLDAKICSSDWQSGENIQHLQLFKY